MHDLAFCTVQFHPISITSVPKVIQFFLRDIAIFVCVDGASQLCTICKFHLNTLTFCAKFINEALNEISAKTDLWSTPLIFSLQPPIPPCSPSHPPFPGHQPRPQSSDWVSIFPPVNWVVPKWHLLKHFNEDWIPFFRILILKNIFYQGTWAQSSPRKPVR